MGFVTTMLVCDYISGATGSIATAFGAHTGIGTMPITLYGTEEQKQKYVPKLASGEWFGAYWLRRLLSVMRQLVAGTFQGGNVKVTRYRVRDRERVSNVPMFDCSTVNPQTLL